MPRSRRRTISVFAAEDLPICPGPRLHPFFCIDQRIEWFERLGSGRHGYVYKVKIDAKLYALKFVSETRAYNTTAAYMQTVQVL